MKLKALVTALCVASMPFAVNAESVVKQAQQEQSQQTQHNIQREAGFNHTQQTVKAQYDALVAERNKLKTATEVLSTTFSTNEQHLSTLEQQLRLESGSLGELFGVVRQTAKEVQAEQQHAVTAIDNSQDNAVVNDIVAAKALPSMVQLQGLWQAMTDQIVASGQIAKVTVPYINGDGEQSDVEALRLGSIGLVGDNGYLRWDGSQHVAMAYLQQPEHAPTLADYQQLVSKGNEMLVVDPSRGVMLEQLAQSPTLMDRLQAGGAVGKVILLLLVIGAGIAIFRGVKLAMIRQQIKAQLKQPVKAR